MQYLISFLEGVITFISPCLLPMLPVYVSYFAGGGERSTGRTLSCAAGFVAGFTVVFMAMGALAGTIGSFLVEYQKAVNLVSGVIVIMFGLNYLGLFRWNLFHGGSRVLDAQNLTFLPTVWFGILISALQVTCTGWNPGFPANAPIVALTPYCLGLGVPLLMIALLIYAVIGFSNWMKRHYRTINLLCGCFLILAGVVIASGLQRRLLQNLNY